MCRCTALRCHSLRKQRCVHRWIADKTSLFYFCRWYIGEHILRESHRCSNILKPCQRTAPLIVFFKLDTWVSTRSGIVHNLADALIKFILLWYYVESYPLVYKEPFQVDIMKPRTLAQACVGIWRYSNVYENKIQLDIST